MACARAHAGCISEDQIWGRQRGYGGMDEGLDVDAQEMLWEVVRMTRRLMTCQPSKIVQSLSSRSPLAPHVRQTRLTDMRILHQQLGQVLTSIELEEGVFGDDICPAGEVKDSPAACFTSSLCMSGGGLHNSGGGACCRGTPSPSPARTLVEEPVVSAVEVTLSNPVLLSTIFEFLIGIEPRALARRQIGDLAEVSKQWRDLARSERVWRPIAEELFPVMTTMSSCEGAPAAAASSAVAACSRTTGVEKKRGAKMYWPMVKEYGKSVCCRHISIAEWHEGIRLTFEVFDSMDNVRLFSASGPIRVLGTTKPGSLALKLVQPKRFYARPFSAASRDPEHLRFNSVTEFFTQGHEPEYPSGLSVRVMAVDEKSNKMAMLYQSGKQTKHWIEPMPNANLQANSLLVNQHWTRVSASHGQAMQLLVVFFVAPVAGQPDDLAEIDRLYTVLESQSLYITLQFKTDSSEEIGRFIRGLLQS